MAETPPTPDEGHAAIEQAREHARFRKRQVLIFRLAVAALVTGVFIFGAMQLSRESDRVSVLTTTNCQLATQIAASNANYAATFAYDRAFRQLLVDLALTMPPKDRRRIQADVKALKKVKLVPVKVSTNNCGDTS